MEAKAAIMPEAYDSSKNRSNRVIFNVSGKNAPKTRKIGLILAAGVV